MWKGQAATQAKWMGQASYQSSASPWPPTARAPVDRPAPPPVGPDGCSAPHSTSGSYCPAVPTTPHRDP
eukprot:scaffold36760_cov31-Prasinocladus_malaysianus.AAC.1